MSCDDDAAGHGDPRGRENRAVPPLIATRRASPEDVDAMLAHVQAGFDSYIEFAPAGWRPPQVRVDRDRTLEFLSDSQTWALLALADDATAGHIAFLPARQRSPGHSHGRDLGRPQIPGLVHLWQLFVLPEWWGRGVAPMLHDAAIDEIRACGYVQSRLFTPSQHARARRFYERRGWTLTGEEWNDGLRLVLTEYRRALD
jgi:GNAT superfamily N-acetyltransferase